LGFTTSPHTNTGMGAFLPGSLRSAGLLLVCQAGDFLLLLIGGPFLVLLTSFVTLKEWLRHDPRQVIYVPGVLFLRMLFVVATLVGTIDVSQSLPAAMKNRGRSGA